MPDCPKCGHNPNRKFKAADLAALLQMLRSDDIYASSGAAAQLGDRGDPAAVPHLIEALLRSVRAAIAVPTWHATIPRNVIVVAWRYA